MFVCFDILVGSIVCIRGLVFCCCFSSFLFLNLLVWCIFLKKYFNFFSAMRLGKGAQGGKGMVNSTHHIPQAPGTAAQSLPPEPTPGETFLQNRELFGKNGPAGGKADRRPRPWPAREGRPAAFLNRAGFPRLQVSSHPFFPPKETSCRPEQSGARAGAASRPRHRFQV